MIELMDKCRPPSERAPAIQIKGRAIHPETRKQRVNSLGRTCVASTQTTIHNAVGKETSNSNSLASEDNPIHGWYRFVLSYPPHLVRKYLKDFGLRPGSVILDPFCGTGTTVVETQKNGFKSIGMDAHPFAAFVSKVKTTWSLPLTELRKVRAKIVNTTSESSEKQMLYPLSFTHLLLKESPEIYTTQELTEDQSSLIPEGFMSANPLRRLLILKNAIESSCPKSDTNRDFFYLALCHVVANGAGNFAFGPEIYRTKSKTDYDVLGHFAKQTQMMIDDLLAINQSCRNYAEATILQADARTCDGVKGRIDAVITSPPYPNEKDYTRTTRVEAVLLGILDNKKTLRELKNSLLRSNTRNVFVNDTDSQEVLEFESVQRVCEEIERRRTALGKTSGFEKLYHKVVAHYFGGMRKHFRSLRPHLRDGAKLAYVVGDQLSFLMVPVRTASLLAEIASTEGYVVERVDLWRERTGTKVRNSPDGAKTVKIREEVLVLQKR